MEIAGYRVPLEVVRIREDIKTMKIRGAGNIARHGAQAIAIAAEKYSGKDLEDFKKYLKAVADYVKSARPTAVSLPNSISYVMSRLEKGRPSSVEEAVEVVTRAAREFIAYSENAVKVIAQLGAKRIERGDTLMTHCHSRASVEVIITAHRQGKVGRVYVKETRPALQGLITAAELAREGVEVVLIPDSAVRYYMKRVDKVVVGADAVAANGAVINKIGTSLVALAAKEARARVYVASETYKFSPYTIIGELVPIEVREPTEIVDFAWLAENPGVEVFNPVFDATPPEYVDAIITEKGVIPPQSAMLILVEEYGVAPTSTEHLAHAVDLE
ncbi:MAG: ribose 1,5-bisphosphate isomerase [Sulfolobales archaeon]|nr:ribose 1,5-bisphosphate isomerase [Sulfolobales archaeon]MCX8209035.1 ribose 1,5-bisphosphate isomerase [Sulfolobales archaeon]MDW8010066.1 ribose 1,5-bisphosphate isomerase [Sulfolobales archaeon]